MWSTICTSFSKYKYLWIASFILITYLLPYYLLGEDMHIRVHDNLDSNIVWYKLLAESGQIFAAPNATLSNVINGLPRSALPSGLDAMVWLYKFFEPQLAYAIGQTLMRFFALFGMYILLKKHFITEKANGWIIASVSLGFSMLPFWPSGMLSIAGLPLALHLFLTIRKEGTHTPVFYWILICILPFLSNFILTFIFFLGLMSVLWVVDWIRNRRVNGAFFSAISVMAVIYLVNNYMTIYSMFVDEGFTSHREAMSLGHNTFTRSIGLAIENFLYGHTHDMAVHTQIILPVIGFVLLAALFNRLFPKQIVLFVSANGILSIWYAFWYWEGWRGLKDQFMLLNTFNFSRIHFFDPVIWYIGFALALVFLWKQLGMNKVLIGGIIIGQLFLLLLVHEEVKYSDIGTPTLKEFYSEELFNEIDDYIGEDKSSYRVVSIGIHPTIAQYNGFYTLDTYNNSFPLEYKREFREIIEPELEKNNKLKNYFDTWGGRLYMYVGALGENYMFTKNSNIVIEELAINTDKLYAMGGKYIFSALPIENNKQLDLEFKKTFQTVQSPWRIYLYEVND
ncbi:DUF6044 family protein [Virgibacillus sp. W0181]|uniref:DUF6044 family protein n=1 Tax=Virgibacillus sp. W0181 TaxID=3391581 RepID=UPI003F46BAE1